MKNLVGHTLCIEEHDDDIQALSFRYPFRSFSPTLEKMTLVCNASTTTSATARTGSPPPRPVMCSNSNNGPGYAPMTSAFNSSTAESPPIITWTTPSCQSTTASIPQWLLARSSPSPEGHPLDSFENELDHLAQSSPSHQNPIPGAPSTASAAEALIDCHLVGRDGED